MEIAPKHYSTHHDCAKFSDPHACHRNLAIFWTCTKIFCENKAIIIRDLSCHNTSCRIYFVTNYTFEARNLFFYCCYYHYTHRSKYLDIFTVLNKLLSFYVQKLYQKSDQKKIVCSFGNTK